MIKHFVSNSEMNEQECLILTDILNCLGYSITKFNNGTANIFVKKGKMTTGEIEKIATELNEKYDILKNKIKSLLIDNLYQPSLKHCEFIDIESILEKNLELETTFE